MNSACIDENGIARDRHGIGLGQVSLRRWRIILYRYRPGTEEQHAECPGLIVQGKPLNVETHALGKNKSIMLIEVRQSIGTQTEQEFFSACFDLILSEDRNHVVAESPIGALRQIF